MFVCNPLHNNSRASLKEYKNPHTSIACAYWALYSPRVQSVIFGARGTDISAPNYAPDLQSVIEKYVLLIFYLNKHSKTD